MAAPVPDNKGKHAAELRDHVLTVFLPGVNDGLGVRSRPETVPAGEQIIAQFGEIVNFTIEDDPYGAVLVRQRLMAAREIDDTQTVECQPDRAIDILTEIIRAAMRGHRAHLRKSICIGGPGPIVIEHPAYSTHRC